MATYLICYDINQEGANYAAANKALTDRIKELFSKRWHWLDSTWVVVSDLTAAQIRDDLAIRLDENDELLVVKSANVGAWRGFNKEAAQWLHDNL